MDLGLVPCQPFSVSVWLCVCVCVRAHTLWKVCFLVHGGRPHEAAWCPGLSAYSGCLSCLKCRRLYGVSVRHSFRRPLPAAGPSQVGFLLLTCCPPGVALRAEGRPPPCAAPPQAPQPLGLTPSLETSSGGSFTADLERRPQPPCGGLALTQGYSEVLV